MATTALTLEESTNLRKRNSRDHHSSFLATTTQIRRLLRKRTKHIQVLALVGLLTLLTYYTLFLAVITVLNLMPDLKGNKPPSTTVHLSSVEEQPTPAAESVQSLPMNGQSDAQHTASDSLSGRSRWLLYKDRQRRLRRRQGSTVNLKSALDTYYNIPSELFIRFYNGSLGRGSLLPPEYSVSSDTPQCRRFPPLENLKFNNGLYQVLHANFGKVFIKSCHLDNRGTSGYKIRCVVYVIFDEGFFQDAIKIWASPTQFEPAVAVILWSQEGELLAEAMSPTVFAYERFGWKTELPFVLTFDLKGASSEQLIFSTAAISLSDDSLGCPNLTNLVGVTKPPRTSHQQMDFVVCLKEVFLPFTDHSVKLAEWLEMVQILGADKVVVFVTGEKQHANVAKVLRYFKDQGLVETRPSVWPGEYPLTSGILSMAYPATYKSKFRLVHVLLEMMNLQTCVLEATGRYRYAVVMDMDELILPKQPGVFTWDHLMDELIYSKPAESVAPSFCFDEEQMLVSPPSPAAIRTIPGSDLLEKELSTMGDHHYFLSQVFTAIPVDSDHGSRRKCIHDLDQVVLVSAHGPEICVEDVARFNSCNPMEARKSWARSFHYRSKCTKTATEAEAGVFSFPCDNSLGVELPLYSDTTIWKYLTVLQQRLAASLVAMELTPDFIQSASDERLDEG